MGADGLKVNVGASARSFKPPKAGGGGVEPSESDMVAEEIHNLRFTQHTWCVTSRFRSKPPWCAREMCGSSWPMAQKFWIL